MATIIRDLNGNTVRKSLRHFTANISRAGRWHCDSTGLHVMDYRDDQGREFSAFIRPQKENERSAIALAKRLGTPRPD
jgi:hypothetical protein